MAKGNLIRFDWAMKRLLRNKADYTVLEGFLSVLLDEDIKIINIKESESNQEHSEDKFNRVDILVENSDGELFIIEMQNNSEVDYLLRMLYSTSKAITEQLKKGDRYGKICKVYHINIVYFKLGDGEDYVYRGIIDFRGIHSNNLLKLTEEQKQFFMKENIADLFPWYYILCVRDFSDLAKDSLDEWIYYLKNTEIPEHFTAQGLKEAREQLLYDNLSEEEKRAYDHHLNQTRYEQNVVDDAYSSGRFEGKAEGLEEGRAKGLMEGLEKVIINSFQAGYSIEAIAAITGLTQKEIIPVLERETNLTHS
jgi:predicted transposase/invertase (TIGR01784 family)